MRVPIIINEFNQTTRIVETVLSDCRKRVLSGYLHSNSIRNASFISPIYHTSRNMMNKFQINIHTMQCTLTYYQQTNFIKNEKISQFHRWCIKIIKNIFFYTGTNKIYILTCFPSYFHRSHCLHLAVIGWHMVQMYRVAVHSTKTNRLQCHPSPGVSVQCHSSFYFWLYLRKKYFFVLILIVSFFCPFSLPFVFLFFLFFSSVFPLFVFFDYML